MRIDVRGTNVDLQPALGAYAERRMLTALNRFSRRVLRVSIRLIDTNGPKKGVDKKVQVTVDIPRTKPMLVEELHPDPVRRHRLGRGSRCAGRRRAVCEAA